MNDIKNVIERVAQKIGAAREHIMATMPASDIQDSLIEHLKSIAGGIDELVSTYNNKEIDEISNIQMLHSQLIAHIEKAVPWYKIDEEATVAASYASGNNEAKKAMLGQIAKVFADNFPGPPHSDRSMFLDATIDRAMLPIHKVFVRLHDNEGHMLNVLTFYGEISDKFRYQIDHDANTMANKKMEGPNGSVSGGEDKEQPTLN